MTKRVASVSQKGGVGKSVNALFLMDYLVSKAKKVLMIDLDPQGTLTMRLGVSRQSLSLAPILEGEEEVNLQDIVVSISDQISLIPSSRKLKDCVNTADRKLIKIKRNLARLWKEFDYVIIDSPPAVNALSSLAILLANVILVPVNLSITSRDTLKDTNMMIEELLEFHDDLEDTIYFANRTKKKDISVKKQILDQYSLDLGESLLEESMPDAEVAVEERLTERHNHFQQKKVHSGILAFFKTLDQRIGN